MAGWPYQAALEPDAEEDGGAGLGAGVPAVAGARRATRAVHGSLGRSGPANDGPRETVAVSRRLRLATGAGSGSESERGDQRRRQHHPNLDGSVAVCDGDFGASSNHQPGAHPPRWPPGKLHASRFCGARPGKEVRPCSKKSARGCPLRRLSNRASADQHPAGPPQQPQDPRPESRHPWRAPRRKVKVPHSQCNISAGDHRRLPRCRTSGSYGCACAKRPTPL